MQKIGHNILPDGRNSFTVWAQNAETIELHLMKEAGDSYIPMQRDEKGYYRCIVDTLADGTFYKYRIDGEKERPDPASKHQPEGVHGASATVDLSFAWQDAGFNPPNLRNSVFYELHVGTFTQAGTFEAIIEHLPRMKDFGITSIELLPIAEFAGNRNWGYDGVQLFAPHHVYGGVKGLQSLVNAAHQIGIAIYLDLVYNHLGPEGNYLWDYAPYFSNRYHGDWGDSLNFDGAWSDEVRNFFIQNALYWLEAYHIDGFRLDATHALFDNSGRHILEELTTSIHEWGEKHNKRVHVIAENDQSNRLHLLPSSLNGTGLDAQWLDDFHHVIHCQLTGENDGYYADFEQFSDMLKCLQEGFVRSGQWSNSRKRRVGTYSGDIPADRFIVATQNHDQIGNRMKGDRLCHLTDWEGTKLAAGFMLTSPYVPMLFMGEEHAETAAFLYFTSHGDEALIQGVREGRKREFAYFAAQGEPPDPQAEETFQASKINHDLRKSGKHKTMYKFYEALLALRRKYSAFTNPKREDTRVLADESQKLIWLVRRDEAETFLIAFNWHHEKTASSPIPIEGNFEKIFDSTDGHWSERNIMKARELDIADSKIIRLAPKSFIIFQLQ